MKSIELKIKAKLLRRKGFSLSEIANVLKISKSTVSQWIRFLPISKKAQNRLLLRKNMGMRNAAKTLHEKFINSHVLAQTKSSDTLSSIRFNPDLKRLLLSFLIWTEGGKSSDRYVTFINSDPLMVNTFLVLLRQSFVIQNEKIRALIHMHEYHNEEKTMQFWMKITNLPRNQFSKTYRKPHTGHRKRINYQGCIRIRYYNACIARELAALYNSCAHLLGS